MNNDLLYKIALLYLPGVGPVLGRRLVSYLGGVKNIFFASRKELLRVPGIGEKIIDQKKLTNALKLAEEQLQQLEKYQIQAIFYLDRQYPKQLAEFDDSPLIIFTKGDVKTLSLLPTLAVVGTRKPTMYGRQACYKLIKELVESGIKPLIISGLAYGIDYCTHKAAIDLGLKTIAVLANGLHTVYPAQHKNIARQITDIGLLISENPTDTTLEPKLFVRRNRIIAALAQAVVIVESGTKGGALFTAQYANIYKRKVFAFAGRSIDERSLGCNWLIKKRKAELIDNAQDLIQQMNWQARQRQLEIEFPKLTDEEQKIVDLLKETEKLFIDNIAYKAKMPINQVLSLLFQLEIKGIVEQLPGNFYALKIR